MMWSGFAIGGKARSGKNVLGERLGQMLLDQGDWPVLLSFAAPLKEMVARENGHARKAGSGRDAMLLIGDRERAKDPDVFVKILKHKVDAACVAGLTPIITDVRRANEFDWCCDAGLFTAFLDAPIEDRIGRLRARGEPASVAHLPHPTESESYTFPWHVRLFNRHSVNPGAVVTDLATDLLAQAGWL